MDLPNPMDVLKQEDYPSREAWLEACADLEMKRSRPEFKKALEAVTAEDARREAVKRTEEFNRKVKELSDSITLSDHERREVERRASSEALASFRRGEISEGEIAGKASALQSAYEEQARKTKASHDLTNAAFRAALGLGEK